MSLKRNSILWLLWIALTLVCGSALAAVIFVGGPRQILLIGKTAGAHHQIEQACDTCHTSGFFEDSVKADKAMNEACLGCHKDELKVSNDSHPVKKFRDPRNADRREKLDALFCTSCHKEHAPEITRPVALTQPEDYCVACHQEVAKERPSHVGLGFETCASAGCHNFHDNTALYEEFLLRNAGAPDIAESPVRLFPKKPAEVKRLTIADAVAPDDRRTPTALADWAGSAHAAGGVNCAGCHAPEMKEGGDLATVAAAWVEFPPIDTCKGCHRNEAVTFVEGKHGMQLHPKVAGPRAAPESGPLRLVGTVFRDSALPEMTVAAARLQMKPDAAEHGPASCSNCHSAHEVDVQKAATEACVACHDDNHSRAYFSSAHARLAADEKSGAGVPGTGVDCATCHMPVIGREGREYTTHNQNAYLRPNEKMIRPVCMNCHSLAFSIDALADPDLVESNFNGRPPTHVPSVDWAAQRARKTE